MKITPVLQVEEIEKSLPFWVDQLGFQKTVEVLDGDRLGFVILQKRDAELMLQTEASVKKDLGDLAAQAGAPLPPTALYIEVADFPDTLQRLGNAPVIVPVRTTFYGMKEIVVREPGGHIACFAAKA